MAAKQSHDYGQFILHTVSDLIGEQVELSNKLSDIGFDDLDMIDLVCLLEREYGIVIDDTDLAGSETIMDIIAKLTNHPLTKKRKTATK